MAALSACAPPAEKPAAFAVPAPQALPDRPPAPEVDVHAATPRLSPREAVDNFVAAADVMTPRIRQECLNRPHGARSCDFRILVDGRKDPSPNAFQLIDGSGRPVICLNLALIAEARDRDEIAFVIGHEAAHHILGHIDEKERDAARGSVALGVLAAASGADETAIARAQTVGAKVGEDAYSQEYELEADRLGAVIAHDAGYDPVQGAQFFARLPDPGDSFLSSHPPNRARLALVENTMRRIDRGETL